jgi:YHS domain-containing protein
MSKNVIYGLFFALVLIGLMIIPRLGGFAGGCCSLNRPAQALPANAVAVNNKICPVSGNPVGEMGPPIKVAYHGKIYNLCCPMCIGTFNSNPEKYSKIADAQATPQQKIKES